MTKPKRREWVLGYCAICGAGVGRNDAKESTEQANK